jgi:hypothetical protein
MRSKKSNRNARQKKIIMIVFYMNDDHFIIILYAGMQKNLPDEDPLP